MFEGDREPSQYDVYRDIQREQVILKPADRVAKDQPTVIAEIQDSYRSQALKLTEELQKKGVLGVPAEQGAFMGRRSKKRIRKLRGKRSV